MKQFKTELDRRKAETVEVNDPVCDLTNCQTGDYSKISLKLIYTRRNKANNISSRERESICRIQHVDHAVAKLVRVASSDQTISAACSPSP